MTANVILLILLAAYIVKLIIIFIVIPYYDYRITVKEGRTIKGLVELINKEYIHFLAFFAIPVLGTIALIIFFLSFPVGYIYSKIKNIKI